MTEVIEGESELLRREYEKAVAKLALLVHQDIPGPQFQAEATEIEAEMSAIAHRMDLLNRKERPQ